MTPAQQAFRTRVRNKFPGRPLKEAMSLYQSWVRSKVSSESCRANGKKGFAKLVELGKEDIAREKAADWRFEHLSDLEKIVIDILTRHNLPVDRQHREVKVGKYYVDFKYGDYVIEVNDDTWHSNDFHGDDRIGHDQGKYAFLRSEGLTIIILSEKVVRSGEVVELLEDLAPTLQAVLRMEF